MSFETRRIRPKENVEIDLSECGTCKCPEKKTMRVPARHLMCCIWVSRLTHRYAAICVQKSLQFWMKCRSALISSCILQDSPMGSEPEVREHMT